MRRSFAVAVLAGASVALAALVIDAGAATASPSAGRGSAAVTRTRWGKAELVPGLVALNKRYNADVTSVSCWGPGGCQIGGYYTDIHRHRQAFLARENKGRWANAAEVPGTATLNHGNAEVTSVTCARTTVCVAVGTYTDKAGSSQWFTTNERNGRWAAASEVPYPALNKAAIDTVWCSTGGLCASGGWYTDPSGATQAWVRTETNGRWQPGLEVPGIAALNVTNSSYGDFVGTVSVACATAGYCAAGGQYTSTTSITDNGFPALQAFVVTETHGKWGNAEEVPGTQSLNAAGGDANTTSITCPSLGSCTAAGWYQPVDVYSCDPPANPNDGPGPPPFYGCGGAFVVNQRHGVWDQASSTPISAVSSLACPVAGDCVTAGYADVIDSPQVGALVSETNGKLGGTLTFSGTADLPSVSCASAGYCATGGETQAGHAFLLTEWGGAWGKPAAPGGLPRAGTAVNAVGCPPKTFLCLAGGNEIVGKGSLQAFIVSQATYRAG